MQFHEGPVKHHSCHNKQFFVGGCKAQRQRSRFSPSPGSILGVPKNFLKNNFRRNFFLMLPILIDGTYQTIQWQASTTKNPVFFCFKFQTLYLVKLWTAGFEARTPSPLFLSSRNDSQPTMKQIRHCPRHFTQPLISKPLTSASGVNSWPLIRLVLIMEFENIAQTQMKFRS